MNEDFFDDTPSTDNDRHNANLEQGCFAISGIIIFISCLSLYITWKNAPALGEQLSQYWALKGTIGDYVGGVFGTIVSLIAFIFLYLSFKKQSDIFKHEKVENRFFELLRLHRDNVSEMSYTYPMKQDSMDDKVTIKEVTAKQRKVFRLIFQQFIEIEQELGFLFEEKNIQLVYQPEYLSRLTNNRTIKERNIDLLLYAKIDILYLVLFFGVRKEGRSSVMSFTKGKYDTDFIKLVLDIALLKPRRGCGEWDQWEGNNMNAKRNDILRKIVSIRVLSNNSKYETMPDGEYYASGYTEYYGGHQHRLSHYFRHLYQSVQFINENQFLTLKGKRVYVRYLRGQLSTYEQNLFFLNSLSQLGRVWEYENREGKEISSNNQLVTKYDLIKNVPNDQLSESILISSFYPGINFQMFNS